jgi:hypothetical protein
MWKVRGIGALLRLLQVGGVFQARRVAVENSGARAKCASDCLIILNDTTADDDQSSTPNQLACTITMPPNLAIHPVLMDATAIKTRYQPFDTIATSRVHQLRVLP